MIVLLALAAFGSLLATANAKPPREPQQRPFLTTSQGVYPLKFGYGTSCTFQPLFPQTPTAPAGGALCVHGDGVSGQPPLARARLGEVVTLTLERGVDSVRVASGTESVELGAGERLGWPIRAVGSYIVTFALNRATETERYQALYSVRLHVVARPSSRRAPE